VQKLRRIVSKNGKLSVIRNYSRAGAILLREGGSASLSSGTLMSIAVTNSSVKGTKMATASFNT